MRDDQPDAPLFPPAPTRSRSGRALPPPTAPSTTRRVIPPVEVGGALPIGAPGPIGGPPPGASPPVGPPPSAPGGRPAAAGTPGRRSSGEVVVGVVNGGVTVERVPPDPWGVRVLAAVVAVSLVVGVLLFVRSGRSSVLVSVVLPALALAVLLGAGWSAGRGRPAEPPTGTGEPVRRFRVRSVTGDVVACVLRGELSGDEVRHGDMVRVSGRRARDGHVVVRHVDVLSAPAGPVISRVSGRPRLRVLLGRVSYVVAGLIALWVAAVATGHIG